MKEGWKEVAVGDVVNVISGKHQRDVISDSGNYPIYGSGGKIGMAVEYLSPAGSTIIGRKGTINSPIFMSEPFWNIDTAFGMKPNGNELDDHYFYYFCEYFNFSSLDKSTAVPSLAKRDIKQIQISFPPLPEQRAIVVKLELLLGELDRSVGELEVARGKLGVYRASVLKEGFGGRLTEGWREDHDLPSTSDLSSSILEERQDRYQRELEEWKLAKKEGQKVRKPKVIVPMNTEEKLEDLPVAWKEVALIEIVETVSDGPFGSKLKTSDYEDEGVRVIRLENIKNLWFDDSKKTFVSEEKYESIANHTVYAGELVFSTFIADETRVTIVPANIKFAVNKADCLRVVPTSLVDSKYLLYFLSTRSVYQQLAHNVHGATRPRINTTQLKDVKVPFCSLPEQQQIVSEIETRLSVADGLEREILGALERVKGLRMGVLKKAFLGELV